MATLGPLNPTTAAGTGWTSPANIEGNSAFATQTIAAGVSGTTNVLSGETFGFTVPVGATIDGIQVSITRKISSHVNSSTANFTAGSVKLRKASVAVGTGKSDATNWPTAAAAANFGSVSDLWGTTWTVAEINAAGFGVGCQADYDNSLEDITTRIISVNNYQITITYTAASGVTLCQTSTFGF